MLPTFFLRASVRRLVLLLVCLTAIAPFAASQACTTTITGIVYTPNGNDPLPNVLVYIPTTPVLPFPTGVTSCQASSQLVTGSPLVNTVTDAKGSYTLTSPALAGTNVPIVIQAGKWRRQLVIPTVTACATTTFSTRMPQTHLEGDIPQIAVVSGSADAAECVLRKVGVADSEFSNPGGGGRINFYAGSGAAGASIDANTPSQTVLMSNQATLNSYDMVMFPCQGGQFDQPTTYQNNLVNYADIGGRVFTTHYGYVWLNNSTAFAGTAKWVPNINGLSANSAYATIDQTYPEGKILSDWLQNIGATTTAGQLLLSNTKKNQNGVIPPTQSWATLNDPAFGNPVMQFTFDTPIGAASSPTISVGFTNNPANFLVGDTADTVTISIANTSTSAADPTLNLTVTVPTGVNPVSLAGTNSGTGWICNTGSLTCTRTTPLAAGASDPVTLVAGISSAAPLGSSTITAVLNGGGLANTSKCGRVLYNEYHVETPAGGRLFPAECQTGVMTPQEKFLEFSLFNLSNFVAPQGQDPITIQSPSVTQITSLISPIYYGQIIGYTNGVNAIVSTTAPQGPGNGQLLIYVDGALVCTLQNDASQTPCPNGGFSGQNVGPHTIYATYSGDATYVGSTSPTYTVNVIPDLTTATNVSSLNPATAGQAVTFSTQVTGNYATPVGPVNFYDGSNLLGSVALDATGTASYTTSILAAGFHFITSNYPATLNFNGVATPSFTQIIVPVPQPIPTFMTLGSSLNPSAVNQGVTFTATVSSSGALVTVPTGSVNFLDGSTVIGTSTINNVGIATLSTSSLALGSHNITAVYAGTKTIAGSSSSVYVQVVNQVVTGVPPGFLLSVEPGTINIGVGRILAAHVVITPLSGFNQDVTLSCADLPMETTCTFAQPVIAGANGVTTLDISTIAPHDCGGNSPYFSASTAFPFAAPVLAGLIFFCIPRRRRALKNLVLIAFTICLLPAISGCAHCTDLGTIPANYTIKVVGTTSAMTVTQSIPFTVHI